MTVVFRSCMMLAVVSAVVGGQNRRPPTPPTPPVPPTPPAAPVPTPAPRALRLDRDAIREIDGMRLFDLDRLRGQSDEIRAQVNREALEAARVITREQIEAAREVSRQAIDASRLIAPQALMASRDAMGQVQSLAPLQQIADGVYSLPGRRFDTGPFFQSDPADSLFKRANQLLEAYDYRAAAQRFKEVQTKYPSSQYMSRAMYWQAFSLYRSDTDAELREAVSVLEQFIQKYPNVRFQGENGYPADASALAQRIRGTLARRGDAAAARQVAQAAGGAASCDREDLQVKQEALSALWRMDQEAAAPKFEQVLARRDECSLELRRFALRTVTQRGDGKSVALLLATAKSDPSTQMRSDAVNFVARFPSDEVLATLEQIVRSEENEGIRRAAARNLVGYPSPRARTVVRTIVEDNAMSDGMRCDIVNRFNEERGTQEDAAWLRTSYPKITSQSVKRCMVNAIANIGGVESMKWLTDLSGNDQESATIRSIAFGKGSATMTVAELSRMYDNAGNRPMRQQIVQQLNRRKEPEALDKLIDIVKKSADLQVRQDVLRMLTERGEKDAKVRQMLFDVIDK